MTETPEKLSADEKPRTDSLGISLPHAITEESDLGGRFTDQLGPTIKVFAPKGNPPMLRKAASLLGVAALFVILASGIRYGLAYFRFGYSVATAWSGWLFWIGILAGIGWLFITVWGKINQKKVFLHRDGIAFQLTSRKPVLFLWRQLAGVSFLQQEFYKPFFEALQTRAYLYPSHGKPVNLKTYCSNHDLPDLVTHIKARLYPLIQPELIKMADKGQTIYFGGLSVSSIGIRFYGRDLEWNEFKHVNIKDGYLIFYLSKSNPTVLKPTSTIRITLLKVYNPEIILILIQHILDSQTLLHKKPV